MGEQAAAAHLVRRGCRVLAHNLRVGRSEVDLVVDDRGTVVIVEVKTRSTGEPVTRFDGSKIRSLQRASAGLQPRPTRIDLVTVVVGHGTATIRWIKDAARVPR